MDGQVGSPCCPRDSQEPYPTPQFKSINSLALNLLYGPILTSIHDYWKNHIIKNNYNSNYVLLFTTHEVVVNLHCWFKATSVSPYDHSTRDQV